MKISIVIRSIVIQNRYLGCFGWTKLKQRRPSWFCQPPRSWPQLFVLHTVSFTLITSKKVKQSPNIIQSFWTVSTLTESRNGRIWPRRKCCSIKTMNVCTLVCDDPNSRIEIQTSTPSSIFSRFSPLRLLSVFKPKVIKGW